MRPVCKIFVGDAGGEDEFLVEESGGTFTVHRPHKPPINARESVFLSGEDGGEPITMRVEGP